MATYPRTYSLHRTTLLSRKEICQYCGKLLVRGDKVIALEKLDTMRGYFCQDHITILEARFGN